MPTMPYLLRMERLHVSAIVQRVDRRSMLVWIINHMRKPGVVRPKAHSGWIDVGRNADDRIHQLIKQTAMRDDQVAPSRPAQKALESLTCPQEESPVAFACPADVIVRGDIWRLRPFAHFLRRQSLHLADVAFE